MRFQHFFVFYSLTEIGNAAIPKNECKILLVGALGSIKETLCDEKRGFVSEELKMKR